MIKRHETAAEKTARESSEAALSPSTPLALEAPPLLQKHPRAAATWRRLLVLYSETASPIVSAFDQNILIDYCLLEEECAWLAEKRAEVDANAVLIDKMVKKLNAAKVPHVDEVLKLLEQYQALMTRLQGLDARLDGKRKLVHALAQSLYLTPRSRAGVVPTEKPKEPEDTFGREFD